MIIENRNLKRTVDILNYGNYNQAVERIKPGVLSSFYRNVIFY